MGDTAWGMDAFAFREFYLLANLYRLCNTIRTNLLSVYLLVIVWFWYWQSVHLFYEQLVLTMCVVRIVVSGDLSSRWPLHGWLPYIRRCLGTLVSEFVSGLDRLRNPDRARLVERTKVFQQLRCRRRISPNHVNQQ